MSNQGTITVSVLKDEPHAIRVYDTSGRLIRSGKNLSAKRYGFSDLRIGLYVVAVEIGKRSWSQKVVINF